MPDSIRQSKSLMIALAKPSPNTSLSRSSGKTPHRYSAPQDTPFGAVGPSINRIASKNVGCGSSGVHSLQPGRSNRGQAAAGAGATDGVTSGRDSGGTGMGSPGCSTEQPTVAQTDQRHEVATGATHRSKCLSRFQATLLAIGQNASAALRGSVSTAFRSRGSARYTRSRTAFGDLTSTVREHALALSPA